MKYIEQKLNALQGEIDKHTIIVQGFDILLVIEKVSRQKVCKAIKYLNDTINQPDLIDIHRTLHPTTTYIHYF